ncbi:hypothetical protein BKK81_07805 [Cupriavidus sp. USMAHM13]|uniref:DUF924 family protein n=1 Tax=Cupriavidus sp. USMAHM13 TaxID=1389192 RepID=UPI0008A6AB12|nr:DUF924 family protein [Cupriavidus sp. USMAHM13]AOY99173.1 hypothetical protein BKK81_07805 [Cupriavidus sp. USMAHM13]
MTDKLPAAARRVLDFWFGTPDSPAWDTSRREWFAKSAAFDDTIRQAFLAEWEAAAAPGGEAQDAAWAQTPEGTCARIVLLDQFPRNLFRGDARSFATDARALALARRLVAGGGDLRLPTSWHRMFCYLPFEHAEELAAQDESVRLTHRLRDESGGAVDTVEWADKHRAIIVRFGRFPHRNAILGRAGTAEEAAFLREPGSSF